MSTALVDPTCLETRLRASRISLAAPGTPASELRSVLLPVSSVVVIADLLERLERQAEEIGRLRSELERARRATGV